MTEEERSDMRLRMATKIVDALVETLKLLNYPLIVVKPDGTTETVEPGKIVMGR